MNPEVIHTVLETLFSLFRTIYRMAGSVKTNQERCQELTKRVQSLENLVLKIQQKGQDQISPSMERTLRNLCDNLESTKEWMMKYTQNKRFKNFIKSGSQEEKFKRLNEKLSENFQLLSLALQVDHGEKIDIMYDTLMQKGVRQRAAIPTFSLPEPTPASQAPVPLSAPVTTLPPLGPYGFSVDMNFSPFGQTSGFSPVVPQPVPMPNMAFSNVVYNSPSVSQVLNFPNMAAMSSIPQFSSGAYLNNGAVAYVSRKTYYLY